MPTIISMLPLEARLLVYRSTVTRTPHFRRLCSSAPSYVQGSKPENERFSRQYFYAIDEHGQLFLHDTKVKNFITAYKDKTFLDFFTKRIRKNDTGFYTDAFPYVSACGKELNFIQPVDSVFVYKALAGGQLLYGGTLVYPFEPSKLSMNEHGRMYHPSPKPEVEEYALISSHLGIELGRNILFQEDGNSSLSWGGQVYEIRHTDSQYE